VEIGPWVAWNRRCFWLGASKSCECERCIECQYRCVRSAQRRAATHSRECKIGTHELCLRGYGSLDAFRFFRHRDCEQKLAFSYRETQLGRRK
jgi:hypothetical protein